jgi:hypothetical protein
MRVLPQRFSANDRCRGGRYSEINKAAVVRPSWQAVPHEETNEVQLKEAEVD